MYRVSNYAITDTCIIVVSAQQRSRPCFQSCRRPGSARRTASSLPLSGSCLPPSSGAASSCPSWSGASRTGPRRRWRTLTTSRIRARKRRSHPKSITLFTPHSQGKANWRGGGWVEAVGILNAATTKAEPCRCEETKPLLCLDAVPGKHARFTAVDGLPKKLRV